VVCVSGVCGDIKFQVRISGRPSKKYEQEFEGLELADSVRQCVDLGIACNSALFKMDKRAVRVGRRMQMPKIASTNEQFYKRR
jgi:hypothetical protein